MVNPMYLPRDELRKFWDKAVAELTKIMDTSNGVAPFGFVSLELVEPMEIAYSQRNFVLSAAISNSNYKHDLRTNNVFRDDIDPEAWLAEWRADPWKGSPNVPWKIDGYKIDDAIADTIMVIRNTRTDPAFALERLLERLRERKYDHGR